MQNQIPEAGFMRLAQIIGNPKRGLPPLIPVSRSTFYQWVREGKAPKPIRLSHGVSVWFAKDIRALIEGAQS
jgi:hypothetical protein